MRTVWINAGELSGDMHGGALLQALHRAQPDLHAVGMGGPHLASAGQDTLLRVESLSVMGLTETLTALPRAMRMLHRINRDMTRLRRAGQLDAVVLIDAPEFNFRVARMAYDLNIPVYYHIPPKVWAWRTGRVRFLERHMRKIFCILPFEVDFYRQHGLPEQQVTFVGNPLVDMVNWPALAPLQPLPHRVGIMPGSRRAEVHTLMPMFGEAARLLHATRPKLEFCCLRAPNMTEAALRSLWPAEVPLTMAEPATRYTTMRSCACMLAASGTATLETALAGTPTVIAYRMSNLSYQLARRVVQVQWAGLANLILGRELFPECLQYDANAPLLASHLAAWLDNPAELETVRQQLDDVRTLCGPPGSADRAAHALLEDLEHLTSERH